MPLNGKLSIVLLYESIVFLYHVVANKGQPSRLLTILLEHNVTQKHIIALLKELITRIILTIHPETSGMFFARLFHDRTSNFVFLKVLMQFLEKRVVLHP